MLARFQSVIRNRRTFTMVFCTLGSLVLISFRWMAHSASDVSPTTIRISVSSTGAEADADSGGAAISATGRYVAFVSWATNLVAGDTNAVGDIFVRDTQSGTVVRASVSSDSTQSNGESYEPVISADGRFVAFTSDASNLVPGDNNRFCDIFVHDLATGATVRVNVASDGHEADAASNSAAISADGRYVAFESTASNLVPADTNKQRDVFLRDLQQATTERISTSATGVEANGMSQSAALSGDARYVAFASTASNLVSPPESSNAWNVFVRDRTTGNVIIGSVSLSGSEGNGASEAPSISTDGHYLAFESRATNLVPGDSNGSADVFMRDLLIGATSRVSNGASGEQGNGASTHPSICADGRFVAFVSQASNLVAGDTNGMQDVFVFDRLNGATSRVSVGLAGNQSQGASSWPALSGDGRYVAFPSGSAQLAGVDTNGADDVFVRGPLNQ